MRSQPRYVRALVIAAPGIAIGLWVLASEFRRNYLPAQLGWRRAQYLVGAAYKSGESVSQDYAKAARWFKLAADGDYPPAAFEYAVLRNYGLGIEEDEAEALVYVRKAADAGIPEAQFLAGSLLLESGNSSEAEEYLRLAAEKRYTPAEYRLASEYIAGTRLRENYVAADILLNDLSNRSFAPAAKLRDHLRSSLMTPDQQAAADKWETQN